MTLTKLILTSTLALAASLAEARTYTLDYGDLETQGRHTLHLKQDLQATYPNLKLGSAEIRKVQLRAKSRSGDGQATLEVGGRAVDTVTIDGRRQDFDSASSRTFFDYEFRNRGNSEGAWQIELRGNIKTRRVRVEVILDEPQLPSIGNQVCFYSNRDFQGSSFCMRSGEATFAIFGGWNDRISSIRVGRNRSVRVCTDIFFQGTCRALENDVANLNSIGLDNKISSMFVR